MAPSKGPSFSVRLKDGFTCGDASWSFNVPGLLPQSEANKQHLIKSISMTSTSEVQEMILRYMVVEPNRAIDHSQLHKYVQVSWEKFQLQGPAETSGLRSSLPYRDTADYKVRLLQRGISLNGTVYRFFGHSNSQLKSGTCYLYAGTESEISAIIESFGEFGAIKTVAKKAKRIGLLFSAAKVATHVAPERCIDIPDIKHGDYIFTDGCGLISRHLAKQLVQRADIRFRNERFTPSVFQIRYRGYKGVLTFEPTLSPHLIHFRDSMRKFKGSNDMSLAVVDFARPYAFGFLNDEVILLLHALGITKEVFEQKQREHFEFLQLAKVDALSAFRFLSYINETVLAEKVLLDGLHTVNKNVQKCINGETAKMINKRGDTKSRILIPRSRLLFGICDPRNVLKEGECAVRVTLAQDGVAKTISDTEILVTRNPCLHPGDLQKFRAVHYPELSHLVDCIVFPVKGRRPSADLMSGGDLDGDKFFVCWDPDIIPAVVAEPAKYSGAKEPVSFGSITYHDRLVYFASYTNASLGRVKNLYLDWAKVKGPMSPECQELNYLFSNCVDGNRISVPSHLTKGPGSPSTDELFVLDYLHRAAASQIKLKLSTDDFFVGASMDVVELLLSRDDIAMSEFELFRLTLQWCAENDCSILEFFDLFDFNQFSDDQRAWVLSQMPSIEKAPSQVLNATSSSTILDPNDLNHFKLNHPGIRWKLLYSSAVDRLALFMPSLGRAMELFVRKTIVFQVDNRLSVAIYIPFRLNRGEEAIVNDGCRLFAFPHSKAPGNQHRLAVPTLDDYRIYYDHASLQLYKRKRGNTWVFITKPGANDASYRTIEDRGEHRRQRQATLDAGENADCIASIALDKFSQSIVNHVGRVNRNKILAAEVYVISNRDVRSLQVLDQWIRLVGTRETLPLFEHARIDYSLPSVKDIDWSRQSELLVEVVRRKNFTAFKRATAQGFADLFFCLIRHSGHSLLRQIYQYLLPDTRGNFRQGGSLAIQRWMMQLLPKAPSLALEFSKVEHWDQCESQVTAVFQDHIPVLLKSIILCANEMQGLVLSPFRAILAQAKAMSFDVFLDLVEYISLTVETPEIALDLLNGALEPESSRLLTHRPGVIRYFVRNCIGIAMEHIEEANESRISREDPFQLTFDEQHETLRARVRIDAQSSVRLAANDHVCLQAMHLPQNNLRTSPYAMYALVERSQSGYVTFRNYHPFPPFFEKTQWNAKHCGSFVTTKAAFEALGCLVSSPGTHCMIQELLLCYPSDNAYGYSDERHSVSRKDLNPSQNRAVQALLTTSLTCLWGPPGTGKTHTLAVGLEELLATTGDQKILVTAPTHNAVDNLLRAFLRNMGSRGKRLPNLVRRVASDLVPYTTDAMVGKDLNDHPAARKKARARVDQARLVFSTCAGASLGLLRDVEFPIVVIDEASQQTEPQSLIPLCKGCERAVLVGDHVQLRATVRPHALLQAFDVSMFERIFHAAALDHVRPRSVQKVMLDTQYRMHASICAFSSREFYAGRLQTAVSDADRPLPSGFPWPPTTDGPAARLVFMQSHHPEDLLGRSKSNQGHVALTRIVCELLLRESAGRSGAPTDRGPLNIAALTPYTACVEALRSALPPSIVVSSIDGFQGREADVVVFVTTRCNLAGEIGFLRDMRRLNVVLTRAKAGLIVIGDKSTLTRRPTLGLDRQDVDPELEHAKRIWGNLIESCVELPADFCENQDGNKEDKSQKIKQPQSLKTTNKSG